MQRPFAVRATQGARQSPFNVQKSVVWPVPCVFEENARQRLCHAYFNLCHAPLLHEKVQFSRSEVKKDVSIYTAFYPRRVRLHRDDSATSVHLVVIL
jgi:hypothetical protein